MKILVTTPLWGQFGGKEQYVLGCVEEFIRMGHHCAVAYGRTSSKPGQALLPLIPQYEIKTYSDIKSVNDAVGLQQLAAALDAEAPDVIFMCDVRNLQLLTMLKSYGGLVPMSHDYSLICQRGTSTTFFRNEICTDTCGLCRVRYSLRQHGAVLESYKGMDTHLVASNYMKMRLIRHGFRPDQVRVVALYTDLQPSAGMAMDGTVPSVLFIGRIDSTKGVDYLMRALGKVSAPFRCSVIGDGDYLPHCKRLSDKLGIADRVDFTGWLTRDKLTEYLSAASLVVVPSLWPEPFGLVGLEAMTCSKPVVAFDSGGVSDWLTNGLNGYLVPTKRTHLLAERIDDLLLDRSKAARMGAEGFRIVKDSFSRQRHFARLLSAFDLAANSKGSVTA